VNKNEGTGAAVADEVIQSAVQARQTHSPTKRMAAWLMVLSSLVAVLILWGGLVRLTGSGLSIPEWPIINGSLLPPFTTAGWETVYRTFYTETHSAQTPPPIDIIELGKFQRMFAIEYFHRFLAAAVGIVFLAIFLRARILPDVWKLTKRRMIAAGVMLIVQAGLGGLVVKFGLPSAAIALHLGTAFLLLSLLLWTALELVRAGEPIIAERKKLRGLGWAATHTVLLQVMSGGLVAGTGAGLLLNTWPKMGAYWTPPAALLWNDWYSPAIMNLFQNQILIQFVHRWLAFIAAGVVIALVLRTISLPLTTRGRLALRAVASILVLQILLGIGNLLMKVPFGMALAHLATGLLLFVTLLVITHELVYAPTPEIS
jgi:heme a synthase